MLRELVQDRALITGNLSNSKNFQYLSDLSRTKPCANLKLIHRILSGSNWFKLLSCLCSGDFSSRRNYLSIGACPGQIIHACGLYPS